MSEPIITEEEWRKLGEAGRYALALMRGGYYRDQRDKISDQHALLRADNAQLFQRFAGLLVTIREAATKLIEGDEHAARKMLIDTLAENHLAMQSDKRKHRRKEPNETGSPTLPDRADE